MEQIGTAALAYRTEVQSISIECSGCQTQSPIRSTPLQFIKSGLPTMTKRNAKIDIKIFIPARSPVCRWAETLLVFSPAFAGVSALIIALIKSIGATQ